MEIELELKLDSAMSLAVGLLVGFALGVAVGSPERLRQLTARVRELRLPARAG